MLMRYRGPPVRHQHMRRITSAASSSRGSRSSAPRRSPGALPPARLDVPRRTALRAVLLMAVFPFSYFFGEVYSESTFLLFTVLGFYGFRTRRWWLGGLGASVAIATRVPGILMMPALAWIAWRQAEPTVRDRAMAVAGPSPRPGWLRVVLRFRLLVERTSVRVGGHHREVGLPPGRRAVDRAGENPVQPRDRALQCLQSGSAALIDTLYGVTGLVFVLMTPFVWYRLGAGYALFMLLNLGLPLSSGLTEGIGRYCSVLFPAFIWLRDHSIPTGRHGGPGRLGAPLPDRVCDLPHEPPPVLTSA